MPNKKTNIDKPPVYYQRSDHLKRLMSLLRTGYSGTGYCGTTKSWLTDSRQCPTQADRYPQLVELPMDCIYPHSPCYIRWNPPPPRLGHINALFQVAPRHYYLDYHYSLVVTGVSNPAFVVRYKPGDDEEKKGKRIRFITHKSTEIDTYDAHNQVVKFSYVIRSKDGKFYYALSSQGAFLVMEETGDATKKYHDNKIIITSICRTRAVPSSVSAKFFREYLFELRGEILLVFLIYKKSDRGLANEIEVFWFDRDTLKLVKLESLRGIALFLEKDCCVWADSREVGCKGNCVYFTGELGDGWWMYDMKTRSISNECVDVLGKEE